MQYTLTTSKGTFLLVEVPIDAHSFEFVGNNRLMWQTPTGGSATRPIAQKYDIIAPVSEALSSEDIAGKIVEVRVMFSDGTRKPACDLLALTLHENSIPYTNTNLLILQKHT